MHALPIQSTTSQRGGKATAKRHRSGKVRFPLPLLLITDYQSIKHSVKLTQDGKDALLKLSKGDMRRALNVLQACHAAYEQIGETEIYNCTGAPQPKDIETVVKSMLGDEFTTSYQSNALLFSKRLRPNSRPVINALKIERGLALQDLITGAYDYIDTIKFNPQARVYLLDQLASTE